MAILIQQVNDAIKRQGGAFLVSPYLSCVCILSLREFILHLVAVKYFTLNDCLKWKFVLYVADLIEDGLHFF